MMIPCRLQVAHLPAHHLQILKKLTANFLFTRIYNMRCSFAKKNRLRVAQKFDASKVPTIKFCLAF